MSMSGAAGAWLLFTVVIMAGCSQAAAAAAVAPATDPQTGLVIEPGWELVRAHCGGCHSYDLVVAQRGNEAFWRQTIRWMQSTQNLWEIPAAQERRMLEYLASVYGATQWGRRPPLAPSLMPPT